MPEAAEDRTFKGQSYGAEKQQQAMVKPVASPMDFTGGAPAEAEEPELPEAPDEGRLAGMEIPGLGNLGDVLFADTDRPDEPFNTAHRESPVDDGPSGPPREWLEIMHDPTVSSGTRDTLATLARLNLFIPHPTDVAGPPTRD